MAYDRTPLREVLARNQGGSGALEEQRKLAFEALERQRALYRGWEDERTSDYLLGAVRGTIQPFGQGLTDQLMTGVSDSNAGQFDAERDLIRQSMANRGLSGSGAETRALVNSQRRIGANTRTQRREINTRAELENYHARERAVQALQGYMAQKAANMWQANQAEIGLRSRFEEVTQDNNRGSSPAYNPNPTGTQRGQRGSQMGPVGTTMADGVLFGGNRGRRGGGYSVGGSGIGYAGGGGAPGSSYNFGWSGQHAQQAYNPSAPVPGPLSYRQPTAPAPLLGAAARPPLNPIGGLAAGVGVLAGRL